MVVVIMERVPQIVEKGEWWKIKIGLGARTN